MPQTFVCDPGTCGHYASPGYELLGLALVGIYNVTDWTDLDQLAATLPPALRKKPAYQGVIFPGKVPCSEVEGAVHQYSLSVTENPLQVSDKLYRQIQHLSLPKPSAHSLLYCRYIRLSQVTPLSSAGTFDYDYHKKPLLSPVQVHSNMTTTSNPSSLLCRYIRLSQVTPPLSSAGTFDYHK